MSRVDAVRVVMGPEEIAAVTAVLESGRIVGGPEVAAFEQEFSEVVGGRTCIAVNSGTSALHLGLLASGIGPGDEVIVPSFTFAATANSVAMTGARPVFADIDPDTFCLDPASAEKAVTERTKAIMPVHLYGQTADWDGFEEVAQRHDLLLLEDAAQAHASTYAGRPAGSLGHVAAFSFYATKNMTTGEGGMVVCADDDTARRVRLLRNQGMERRYENEIAGLNNRMTDIAGAIGRVQLRSLAAWNDRRREIAARYSTELRGVQVPVVRAGSDHVFHQYTIRVQHRDQVLAKLQADGIGADVYYPIPNHQLPAYDTGDELPETARAARECLSLPIHPRLTEDEVQRVVDSVNAAVEEVSRG